MGSTVKLAAKPRQQVAAVCYRFNKKRIQFLLVQTRNERWIFPKGGAEPGLTHAQSAALEALEEAGVHGRMEEIAFTRYYRGCPTLPRILRKGGKHPSAREIEPPVSAHLCEVSRLERPQESNRKPTWFNAEKAKQRLTEDRTSEFGAELARVIDRAVARIERLRACTHRTASHSSRDALHQVKFEAAEIATLYISPRKNTGISLPRWSSKLVSARPIPRLESGLPNVTAIDAVHKAPRPLQQTTSRHK